MRPDLVDVWRKVPGAAGPTGNVATTATQIYAAIASLVDHGANDRLQFSMATGEVVPQTDQCFVDGVMPARFPGAAPGDTVTIDGIDYVVDRNGRAAFIDVRPFDVVVLGTDRYLVLQVSSYTDVLPVQILQLNFGRAWQ